ncbi:hypothetical protein N656DRAFT_789681 [Canariomyces notabilis]|uniref:Protein kinase domain-containing protein n=1 Tax=Canariomyces notabilis TaxID=2074819 RepID=A0AAN6YSF0_9PEZI|nr:hypothetical protein N656DRAFT_789681 [Canariomyces arenarius]
MAFPLTRTIPNIHPGRTGHMNENDGKLASALITHYYPATDKIVQVIRCNGKIFDIELSASYFFRSPSIESRFRVFYDAMRANSEDGSGSSEDQRTRADDRREYIYWLMWQFTPLIYELAQDNLPCFEPENIDAGEPQPLLSQYLFPERHSLRLEAWDDEPIPIKVADTQFYRTPLRTLSESLVQELHDSSVGFFDPSSIEAYFANSKEALNCIYAPSRVLVDLDGSGQRSVCFFKGIAHADAKDRSASFLSSLRAHLRICQSKLGPETYVVRLLGVVGGAAVDMRIQAAGLLLTYVDHTGSGLLEDRLRDRLLPKTFKLRWANQLRDTVSELHEAGIIWGDARPSNVMIDKHDDAWIVDVGGDCAGS